MPLIFRRAFDVDQLYFSMRQTLVHLHKLWQDGIVRREIGSEGIIRSRLM